MSEEKRIELRIVFQGVAEALVARRCPIRKLVLGNFFIAISSEEKILRLRGELARDQ